MHRNYFYFYVLFFLIKELNNFWKKDILHTFEYIWIFDKLFLINHYIITEYIAYSIVLITKFFQYSMDLHKKKYHKLYVHYLKIY